MALESKEQKNDAQDAAPEVSLGINSQYIKDLSLEIPHAPQIFKKMTTQPSLKVDVDITRENFEADNYAVNVTFHIEADIENEKLFILELTYGAYVTVKVPEGHVVAPILFIEVPRLIFPFARNVIAQCLMEGGLPPIMMNPIDFGALYMSHHNQGRQ